MLEEFKLNLKSIKEEIKTEAKRLGFSHIGFTDQFKPQRYQQYVDWINNGFHANMNYLERPDAIEKRSNLKLILPSFTSAIVFAIPYTPAKYEGITHPEPRIAKYAIGQDYHSVIPALLEKIMDFVKEKVYPEEIEYRIYTDTGPILEKDLAQRAGLGWIGNNSCVIIPGFGSFFFLAEILINLSFPPDPPFEKDFCGKCRRCIDHCPTQCILPNRTIDANRCISYLTIENRGHIPEGLHTKINGWIFGCDVCQQVCPWNLKYSEEPNLNYFKLESNIEKINLSKELYITRSEFKIKYINSPISRTRYFGYKRNLLVVSGNHFEPSLIEPLKFIKTHEEDPELRSLASKILEKNVQSQ